MASEREVKRKEMDQRLCTLAGEQEEGSAAQSLKVQRTIPTTLSSKDSTVETGTADRPVTGESGDELALTEELARMERMLVDEAVAATTTTPASSIYLMSQRSPPSPAPSTAIRPCQEVEDGQMDKHDGRVDSSSGPRLRPLLKSSASSSSCRQ